MEESSATGACKTRHRERERQTGVDKKCKDGRQKICGVFSFFLTGIYRQKRGEMEGSESRRQELRRRVLIYLGGAGQDRVCRRTEKHPKWAQLR